MKNFFKGPYFLLSLLIIVSAVLLGLSCTRYFSPGDNKTDEYSLYKSIKSINTLTDLKEELNERQVLYSIENNVLTLNDYSLSFSKQDNNMWQLDANTTMEKFETLDKEDFSVVSVHTKLVEDKIKEEISIKEMGIKYTKIDNNYFTNDISYYCARIVLMSLILIILIFILIIFIKKSRKVKVETVESYE